MKVMSNLEGLLSHLKDPHLLGTAAALALAAAAYCKWSKERQEQLLLAEFESQSIEIPGPDHIRINARNPKLVTVADLPRKTLHEIFLHGVEQSGSKHFLGHRKDENSDYEWTTYDEIHLKAKYLGYALYELGFREGSLIGISGLNKQEWIIVDQGAMMFSMVLVPIYDTLGEQGLQVIMEQTEISILFCDTSKVDMLLKASEESDKLRTVVTFDTLTNEETIQRCKKRGIKVMNMDEVLDLGKKNAHEIKPPSPEDLALICYTSGTTGNPKGVMLTHGALAANVLTIRTSFFMDINPDDVIISYLPLSHMYERMAQYVMMDAGVRIGFFRGNVKELLKDIQMLRPTLFPSVPRLLNALCDKVMGEVSKSWLKSCLVNTALASKESDLKRGIIRNDSIWDKLVLKKIQALLGGRVRILVTGAAPLSSYVKTFLKCAFGCHVIEGYGQTEVCALATGTLSLDPSVGHVGPPAPCCRIKLVDVPELDYFASDGSGEVCIQGPSVFSGYYKDKEKTKEALDEDGWCHTGDIGKWQTNGALAIIDRKKHIFKLSQGEYIAPEKIENIYLRSHFVAQVFVTGYSSKSATVGLVSPDPDYLMNWAQSHHINGSFEELCKKKAVKDAIFANIREIGESSGLNSLEQVKAIHLMPQQFTTESGFLTPTMKLKRRKAQDAYVTEIDALYEEIEKKYKMATSSSIK